MKLRLRLLKERTLFIELRTIPKRDWILGLIIYLVWKTFTNPKSCRQNLSVPAKRHIEDNQGQNCSIVANYSVGSAKLSIVDHKHPDSKYEDSGDGIKDNFQDQYNQTVSWKSIFFVCIPWKYMIFYKYVSWLITDYWCISCSS